MLREEGEADPEFVLRILRETRGAKEEGWEFENQISSGTFLKSTSERSGQSPSEDDVTQWFES